MTTRPGFIARAAARKTEVEILREQLAAETARLDWVLDGLHGEPEKGEDVEYDGPYDGPPMHDFHFRGACLRVVWLGWVGLKHPLPYAFHRWGFYGFGVGPVRFMFWPAEGEGK